MLLGKALQRRKNVKFASISKIQFNSDFKFKFQGIVRSCKNETNRKSPTFEGENGKKFWVLRCHPDVTEGLAPL